MSRYYSNYYSYLGAQRCCNVKTQCPAGPVGPTGIGAIGPRGYDGPIGYTGPTGRGCRGEIGPTGPAGVKSFVINHPLNTDKYLVHACLEGPESGVYYRGKGVIENNVSVEIEMPDYASALATDFTIQVTPIFNASNATVNGLTKLLVYNVSDIINNRFTVYGENGSFFWTVVGRRMDATFNIEPLKTDVQLKGDGPYLYI
jgi:hypothetical protein